MREELDALAKNKTWILIDKPQDAKVFPNRWVYKIKSIPESEEVRLKARLVIRGFLQKEGIDYKEIYSPVARYSSVRAFFAIVAANGMHCIQFDVKSAFLNGDLSETVYMQQPEGFWDGTDKICKLKKSLYGLKQAARCWNAKFVKCLKKFKLYPSASDPCLFISIEFRELLILII